MSNKIKVKIRNHENDIAVQFNLQISDSHCGILYIENIFIKNAGDKVLGELLDKLFTILYFEAEVNVSNFKEFEPNYKVSFYKPTIQYEWVENSHVCISPYTIMMVTGNDDNINSNTWWNLFISLLETRHYTASRIRFLGKNKEPILNNNSGNVIVVAFMCKYTSKELLVEEITNE